MAPERKGQRRNQDEGGADSCRDDVTPDGAVLAASSVDANSVFRAVILNVDPQLWR